jgi:hypothetical protein
VKTTNRCAQLTQSVKTKYYDVFVSCRVVSDIKLVILEIEIEYDCADFFFLVCPLTFLISPGNALPQVSFCFFFRLAKFDVVVLLSVMNSFYHAIICCLLAVSGRKALTTRCAPYIFLVYVLLYWVIGFWLYPVYFTVVCAYALFLCMYIFVCTYASICTHVSKCARF